MTNDELLHKWVNGTITAEELEVFKLRPEYPSLVALYEQTTELSAPDFKQEAMLATILKQEKKGLKPERGRRLFINRVWKYGVAASLLIIAGWFLFSRLNSEVLFQTANGERTQGALPDGSTFVLNADSRLSYDKNNWGTARKISLTGEAFFSVQKGAVFSVETPTGSVQVLGTKFNVWSRNNLLEAAK